jgi:hypothetical protein
MRRATFSLLAIVGTLSGLAMALLGTFRIGPAEAGAAGAEMQAQVLASTLQIEIYDAGQAGADGIEQRGARGLATLVEQGGQPYIVTHSHWSLPPERVNSVELRDAAGKLLLVLDGAAFRSLVVYQDAGTLLLAAPPGLQGVVPATPSGKVQPVKDQAVALATRDESGGVAVVMAIVERVETEAIPARLHLRGPAGAVVPGDSGDGLWLNGRLAGNLWSIGVVESRSRWSEWYGGASERPTDVILAGLQPLGHEEGLVAADLGPEGSEVMGYERGPQR